MGEPRILILGGWSPGPLHHLKYYLKQKNCVVIEPNIPMPPMGCSWCCDVSMFALLAVLGLMMWGCISVQHTRGARLIIVAVSLVLLRRCVAWIVRRSIKRGVQQAERYLPEVAIVIGFSWGGGIVAELLRRALVGGDEQAAALLIAPTTALMASVALQRDAASVVRSQDSNKVHVFHGRHDQAFCPHAQRWEQTGVTLHLCEDNHVFLRQDSIQALVDTLAELLDNSELRTC